MVANNTGGLDGVSVNYLSKRYSFRLLGTTLASAFRIKASKNDSDFISKNNENHLYTEFQEFRT